MAITVLTFRVYRIDLSFFTREVLVSGICGGECADAMMGRTIQFVIVIQVDSSKLNTLAFWSQISI